MGISLFVIFTSGSLCGHWSKLLLIIIIALLSVCIFCLRKKYTSKSNIWKPHLPYFGMTWKGLERIVSSWGRMLAKYRWLLFRTFASTQKMMSRIITEDNTTKEIQIWRIAVLAGAHRCFTKIDKVLVTNEQLRRPVIVGKTSKMFCEAVMHHIQQKKKFQKIEKNIQGNINMKNRIWKMCCTCIQNAQNSLACPHSFLLHNKQSEKEEL